MSTKNQKSIPVEEQTPVTDLAERETMIFGLANIKSSGAIYTASQKLVSLECDLVIKGREAGNIVREQCKRLYEVKRDETYKDGYESLAKYVEALELPSFYSAKGKFSDNRASEMTTAGLVYTDPKAPESIKVLPWSVLAKLAYCINNSDRRGIMYEEFRENEAKREADPDIKPLVETQEDAKTYIAQYKRAEAIRAGKDPDEVKSKGKSETKDEEQTSDEEQTPATFEVVRSGVAYTVDTGNGIKFAFTREQIAEAFAGENLFVIFSPDMTIGAIVDRDGTTAEPFKLTRHDPKTPDTVTLPTPAQIAIMRDLDPQFRTASMNAVIDLADRMGI